MENSDPTKNGKKKEDRRLARLVKKKMEDYMNKTKRENRFNPAGALCTTKRMHKYDLMYKVIEATVLEKAAKERQRSLGKNGKKQGVHPKWINNSRQVTCRMEALHLSQAVSQVMDELPVSSLTTVHGFGAGRGRVRGGNNPGPGGWDLRLQGYTSHVGAVLNGKKYADYYLDQGLNTGNPSRSNRLIDLKMRDRHGSVSSGHTDSTLSGGSSRSGARTRQVHPTHSRVLVPSSGEKKHPQKDSPCIESQQPSATTVIENVEPVADDHCTENADHTRGSEAPQDEALEHLASTEPVSDGEQHIRADDEYSDAFEEENDVKNEEEIKETSLGNNTDDLAGEEKEIKENETCMEERKASRQRFLPSLQSYLAIDQTEDGDV